MKRLRLKLAKVIGGRELWAESSRRNKVFKKMVWSFFFTLWEIEMKCDCETPMQHLKQRMEENE